MNSRNELRRIWKALGIHSTKSYPSFLVKSALIAHNHSFLLVIAVSSLGTSSYRSRKGKQLSSTSYIAFFDMCSPTLTGNYPAPGTEDGGPEPRPIRLQLFSFLSPRAPTYEERYVKGRGTTGSSDSERDECDSDVDGLDPFLPFC